MELNIAIVDDMKSDSERLRLDITHYHCPDGVTTGSILCFPNGEALLNGFLPGMFQLVFMDIYMGDMNGIETAKRIRSLDTGVLIVFLTTSREFAFDSFQVHPFEYIVKPYDTERLKDVLNEAVRTLVNNEKEVEFRVGRSRYAVPLSRVSAVMSRGHSVEIVTSDGKTLLSNMTFSEIEALLNEQRFLLCNRGLIINMDHVAMVDNDVFRMRNGLECSIRVRGRAQVLSAFSVYQMYRMRGSLNHGEDKTARRR